MNFYEQVPRHYLDGLTAWFRRQRNVLNQIVNGAWWRIRGVRARDYRALCKRCSRTGQVHWTLSGCLRFTHRAREPAALRGECAAYHGRLKAPNA